MSVGHNIKLARKKQGMTQKELAEKLNISQSAVAKFESDKTNIKHSTVAKFAEILNVSVLDLFHSDERKEKDLKESVERIQQVMERDDLTMEYVLYALDYLNLDSDLFTAALAGEINAYDLDVGDIHKIKDASQSIESHALLAPSQPDEDRLLDTYKLLNKVGKEEALKRINDLTHVKKYVTPDE